MKNDFASGLTYWWRGWGLLWRSRSLGIYAVLPLICAIGFFVGVLWLTLTHLHGWTDHLVMRVLPADEVWSRVAYYPMWLTLFILTFLILIYLSYLLHVILCGPFYTLLAGRTLQNQGKHSALPFRFSLRIIIAAVIKTLIFFLLGAVIFLFSFVPLVNVIGLILTLMMLAFDTMDYSFDVVEWGFRARLAYFATRLPQWLGMAVSLALTLLVPGLTLLILPGAVVGAAMIFEPKSVR